LSPRLPGRRLDPSAPRPSAGGPPSGSGLRPRPLRGALRAPPVGLARSPPGPSPPSRPRRAAGLAPLAPPTPRAQRRRRPVLRPSGPHVHGPM